MFGLKEERNRAAGEEEMSFMERGEKSSSVSESEKDFEWKEPGEEKKVLNG